MLPELELFLKGILLGLTVSMPLGPIGIILINRTLKRGLLSGLFSGLGLATADTILAVFAGLGFTFIIGFINSERLIVSIVAGITIIIVGLKILFTNPVKDIRKKEKSNKTLWRDYYSIFALSISNPYTVLIFVAFFSGIHINVDIRHELIPFFLIPGVFVGTVAWWLFLSWFVSRFNNKIRLRGIVRVNTFSGIAVIVIGVIVLLSLFTTIKL